MDSDKLKFSIVLMAAILFASGALMRRRAGRPQYYPRPEDTVIRIGDRPLVWVTPEKQLVYPPDLQRDDVVMTLIVQLLQTARLAGDLQAKVGEAAKTCPTFAKALEAPKAMPTPAAAPVPAAKGTK